MADTSLGTSRITRPPRKKIARVASPAELSAQDEDYKPSKMVMLMVVAILVPASFYVGPLKLNPYKLLLLIAFIPLLVKWVARHAGTPKGIDFLILFHGAWAFMALIIVHGFIKVETAGVTMVETVGAYFMGRIFVRTPQDFAYLIKVLCVGVVCFLPIAFIEATTSRIILNEILGNFLVVHGDLMDEMRWGMHRVQGPFEHPILFGVFCATLTAPAFLVWGFGKSASARNLRLFAVSIGTFLSLSMGAYISFLAQIALFSWDRIMHKFSARWLIMFAGFLAFYILIDVLADRPPVQVFIGYLSFNSGASWNRILIWEYGSAEVLRHPLFGIGFNDWQRPHWMVESVDNFWLRIAMLYGIPGFMLLFAAFVSIIVTLGRRDFSNSQMMRDYRLAYLISLGGLMLSLCTVHVWAATYVFLLFFIGSGVWMRDYEVPKTAEGPDDTDTGDDDAPAEQYYSPRRRRNHDRAKPTASAPSHEPARRFTRGSPQKRS